MKQILKTLAILAVFMTLTNCVNENLDISNQDASVGNAKKWFELNKPSLTVLDYTQTVDWSNAIVSSGDKGTIVEVPLILKANIAVRVGDDKSYKTSNRLLFIVDKQDTYKTYHVLITTNDVAFDNNNKDCNFYRLNTNFNGYISVVNDKKEITDYNGYLDGNVFLTAKTSKTTNDPTSCTYLVEMYDDGSTRPIALLFCSGGDYGGGGTGYGSGGGKGEISDPVPASTVEMLLLDH